MSIAAHLTGLLYSALAEPIGLLLSASDRNRARQALYQARVQAADPALAELQIRASPWPEGDLVICHRRVLTTTRPSPPPPVSDEEQRVHEILDDL
jgi:hypothetical protein